MSDRSWDPTEPLREDHLRRLEEARLRRDPPIWSQPETPITPTEEVFGFLAAWDEVTIESESLTELRRIRIGVYVTAAGMLILAFAIVLLAMVLSAKPN